MNYRFHPQAEAELHEAFAFYESRRAGLGNRFANAFRRALLEAFDQPLAWPILEHPFRINRLRKFPFGIVYEPREDELVIVAVMHLHRNPGHWKGRVDSQNE